MSSKSESMALNEAPTVEHVAVHGLRRQTGRSRITQELDILWVLRGDENDPRAVATRERNVAVQTLGNMTLLSSALNSAQSNLPWDQKRKEMAKHSLLPINQSLLETPVWAESEILKRGEELFVEL